MKHQGSTVGSTVGMGTERKINKASLLLSPEENQQVFNLLDRKCMSMCTAVVQLYVTDAPAHSQWLKRYTGALCFVKDSGKKSYYCRLYCLMRHEVVWEQEMYDTIQIQRTRPYLLNFEGQDGQVAFNFASEEEAENFHRISTTTVANRIKRREERMKRSSSRKEPPPRPNVAPQISHQHNNMDDSSQVTLRNRAPVMAQPQPVAPVQNFGGIAGGQRMKKGRVGKITKEDIGAPTDFKHITHVGWTEQKGFDWTGEEVEHLKPFLRKAGVSERQLKDRETREFIYDFIQSNKVMDHLQPTSPEKVPPPSVIPGRQMPPPPVPTRQRSRNGARAAPPPPPMRQPQVTPAPPKAPPPGRPPPISAPAAPGAPAPPPPPPPPMAPPPPSALPSSGGPPPPPPPTIAAPNEPDGRSALMESIRLGTKLKTVDRSNVTSSGGDSRSDLLEEIRRGRDLRPASERELPSVQRSSSGAGADALADALRRALMERGRVIQSSDDESNNSTDNDNEWDD